MPSISERILASPGSGDRGSWSSSSSRAWRSRTARPVERRRARARRNTALVYVDGTHEPEPALLRLQSAGVAVAVLREGDDLAAILGAPAFAEAARA